METASPPSESLSDCQPVQELEAEDLHSKSEGLAAWAAIAKVPENKPYLTKMYITSILLVVLPAITYFLIKHAILPLFGVSDSQHTTLYAGVAAIVIVKAVSTSYLISAFKEGDEERKALKNSKSQ